MVWEMKWWKQNIEWKGYGVGEKPQRQNAKRGQMVDLGRSRKNRDKLSYEVPTGKAVTGSHWSWAMPLVGATAYILAFILGFDR